MKKFFKWAGIILLAVFVLGEIIRLPFRLNEQKTAEQVVKIHATKLTLDDVMGKNLPPDPGTNVDSTVAGIDANGNGIRDDVELAVFKAYPNSAKTRAVLLQYALALQMEFTQPIVNKDIVIAVTQEGDRSDSCLADTLVPRKSPESSRSSAEMKKIDFFTSFITKLQINTTERSKAEESFLEKIGSYNSLPSTCDINYSSLPN